ncbi:unnamed protein product [Ambrosiozyma monospora]|uniref:Unnamed protein product n=1 Tax=Ambrosiozyma monospora TaxID=43982 RepID=A0ACB5T0Q0_AMBMO|nr:unnamed protein product [Ambrosiozyma monospora]
MSQEQMAQNLQWLFNQINGNKHKDAAYYEDLKQRKEDFVTGLTGGSTKDIYTVTSISVVSYLAWCIIKKKTNVFNGSNSRSLFSTLVDLFINWNNLLLSITIYCDNVTLLATLTLLPLLPVLLSPSAKEKTKALKVDLKNLTARQLLPFKPYITIYRSQMMIITCVSILAVDFFVFPRRFAKVETWGTSLMDLGVGSFAFSMGLISARGFLRQKFSGKYNYFKNLFSCVKGVLPLLVLALARMMSVKSLEYQEHVTEYGVHWNFFFTLAALPFLCNLFAPLILLVSPIVFSFVIGLLYEYLLVKKHLLTYIIIAKRDSIFSANREVYPALKQISSMPIRRKPVSQH